MARADYQHLSRHELLSIIERQQARIDEQQGRIDTQQALSAEQQALIAEQQARMTAQDAHIGRLEARIKQLEELLDKINRDGKRQAAPFSKGPPKARPKKPGRKAGRRHGRHGHLLPPVTPPDEVIDVPLPQACNYCGGAVRREEVVHQHQIDIPRKPIHRRFDIHVGYCRRCGRRTQPRHPLQTTDALGAAACHLAADTQAAIALMKNRYGLSYGDIVGLFKDVFGISLTPGGAARAVQRAAKRSKLAYEHIGAIVRYSPGVTPDETGWKVGGRLQWLWTFVTDLATRYVIRPSRGRDVLDEVLGLDYAGKMTHDGWAPYDALTRATHQQCIRHLLKRAKDLIEQLPPRAGRFPRAVKRLLHAALKLRDRRDAGAITEHGLAIARGRLERRLDRLLARPPTNRINRRFHKHLRRYRGNLLTFLYDPELEATNWRAEQALRPAVENRKVFGGNRTPAGAHALEILASVFTTCRQHGRDAFTYLTTLLRLPPNTDPLAIPLPLPA